MTALSALDALIADPGSDDARDAFLRWLRDSADPRTPAAGPVPTPEESARWLGDIAGEGIIVSWHGGIPSFATITPDAMREHGEALLSRVPWLLVQPRFEKRSADEVDAFFAAPAIAKVTSLGLHLALLLAPALASRTIERLLAADPPALRRLDTGSIAFTDLERLAAAPLFRRLTRLAISAGGGNAAADRLIAAGLGGLAELDFSSAELDTAGLRRLIAAAPPSMRSLQAWGARIGDEGARLLIGTPVCTANGTLSLAGCGLTGAGLRALAASPNLARVRSLVLSSNRFGAPVFGLYGNPQPAIVALCTSEHLRDLDLLDLADNPIAGEGAAAIAALRVRVGELVVRNCALGDRGLATVAGAPVMRTLEALDAAANAAGDEGATALGAAGAPALERLDLGGNGIGGRGLAALGRGAFPKLHALTMSANPIDDTGAEELARTCTLPALSFLDLGDTPIGDRGATALVDSKGLAAVSVSGLASRDLSLDVRRRIARQYGGEEPEAIPRDQEEERRLLQAIFAAKDDDAPRLVYADWLSERGESWGEFIELQCRLEKTPDVALRERAWELQVEGQLRWLGPWSALAAPRMPFATGWTWRRGFPHIAQLDAQTFVDRGEELFAAWPTLEGIAITFAEETRAAADASVRRLAESPALARVRRLRLGSIMPFRMPMMGQPDPFDGFRDTALRAILASPRLSDLREVALPVTVQDVVEQLLALPAVASLESLTVATEGGDELAEALARATSLSRLKELDVTGSRIGGQGLRRILEAPHLKGLSILRAGASPVFGDEGVEALAASPLLASDPDPQLSNIGLTDRGAKALAGSPHVASLRTVDVSGNMIGEAGAAALAASPWLRGIERLGLTNNPLGWKGVAAFAASAARPKRLWLEGTNAGNRGVSAIAGSAFLTGVQELVLGRNGLGDAAARALAASPMRSLETLDLSSNAISDEGIAALAASPVLRTVKNLTLYHNAIGEEGAEALASADLPALMTLELSDNSIGAAGIEALAATAGLPALESLSARGGRLAPEVIERLLDAPLVARLRQFVIEDYELPIELRRRLYDRFPNDYAPPEG